MRLRNVAVPMNKEECVSDACEMVGRQVSDSIGVAERSSACEMLSKQVSD